MAEKTAPNGTFLLVALPQYTAKVKKEKEKSKDSKEDQAKRMSWARLLKRVFKIDCRRSSESVPKVEVWR